MATGSESYVVRFGPFSVEGIKKSVARQVDGDRIGAKPVRWGVSAFATSLRDGETEDDLLLRLCRDTPANGKTVAVITADELAEWGLVAHEDTPPPNHVLIGDRDLSGESDLTVLAEVWSTKRRRNPAWKNEA